MLQVVRCIIFWDISWGINTTYNAAQNKSSRINGIKYIMKKKNRNEKNSNSFLNIL